MIEDIVNHMKYIANVGGIDTVAIGSDFDGIECGLEFKDASNMNLVEKYMRKNGFSEEEIEKIYYKNALRLFKEVL